MGIERIGNSEESPVMRERESHLKDWTTAAWNSPILTLTETAEWTGKLFLYCIHKIDFALFFWC